MSYPIDNPILPGDMFVKQWGKREIIWVALHRRSWKGKQPWLLLHTGGIISSWHDSRHDIMVRRGASRSAGFRYVGTIPEWFLAELTQNHD